MISSDIEEKQIELAEKLSNYNQVLQFVKTKLSEEELDYYLGFFELRAKKKEEPEESNFEPGKVITMWGDEF
jgi:hypothetical protein